MHVQATRLYYLDWARDYATRSYYISKQHSWQLASIDLVRYVHARALLDLPTWNVQATKLHRQATELRNERSPIEIDLDTILSV